MSAGPRDKRRAWRYVKLAIVLVLAATYLYPFLFMLATALKPASQYLANPAGWPSSLTLSHIRYAWTQANLGQSMVNSAIAVSIGVVVCCTMCSAAAFWFIRHTGKIARTLLGSFGSLWVLPPIVWLVPFFVLLSQLNLTDNLYVLGVVYGTIFAPAFLWLLWAYFVQGIPPDLLEAAEIDGASTFQQYRRVVLPLSRPALATVAALTFVFAWGDLLFAIVLLQSADKFTVVPAAATLVGRYNAAVQPSTAAVVITIIPSLLVFLVAQRAIVRGITGGLGK